MLGAIALKMVLTAHPGAGQIPKLNDAGTRVAQGLQKLDSRLNTPAGRLKVAPWTVGTGGFVQGRNPRWTRSFSLKKGVPFAVVLAGDKSVRTISCAIMNNANRKIEQQASGQADGFTFTYTAPADGSYQLQVGIPGDVKPLSFVCCAFLNPKGVEVSSSMFGGMAAMASTTVSVASSGPDRLRVPPNFSFLNFGLLSPGKSVDYGKVNYAPSAVFGGTDIGRGGLILSMLGADRASVMHEDKGSDEIAGYALEGGIREGWVKLTNSSNQDRLSFFAVMIS